MALQRREVKPAKPRVKFTIIGRLVAQNDRSICIQRHGNSKSKFWMSYDNDKFIPRVGDLVECDFVTSSYIGKECPTYRVSLYYKGFRALPELGNNVATFWSSGDGLYDIVDVLETQTKDLYVVKANNISTNEIMHLRYYSTAGKPVLGTAKITIDINSLSSVIGTDGWSYENKYTREYTDKEGQKRVVEQYTYFPTLVATHILSLSSHGEGGHTEGI